MMAKDWRLAILGIYAATVFVILIEMIGPINIGGALLAGGLFLWALTPIALLCVLPLHPWGLGIGAALVAGGGVYLYYDTAYIASPDALSVLVFLFVPVYQFGVALVWIGACYVGGRFANKA